MKTHKEKPALKPRSVANKARKAIIKFFERQKLSPCKIYIETIKETPFMRLYVYSNVFKKLGYYPEQCQMIRNILKTSLEKEEDLLILSIGTDLYPSTSAAK